MDLDWFKQRKQHLGLTDAKIARIVGRDRSVINKILSGNSGLDVKLAGLFAEAFQVPRAEVLFRAGVTDAAPAMEQPERVLLEVALPNVAVLTDMFAGLLESVVEPDLVGELAPLLAQRLPSGLRRATGTRSGMGLDEEIPRDEAVLHSAEDRLEPRSQPNT
jgi:transcriptional regulator with XRE-family HTH domain